MNALNNPAERMALERAVASSLWNSKRVWLAHFVANGLFLGMGFLWLWIPDATSLDLALTVAIAAFGVVGWLWLQGASLLYFQRMHAGERPSFRSALWGTALRLYVLGVVAVAAYILYYILMLAAITVSTVAWFTGSALTYYLGVPVGSALFGNLLTAFVRVTGWVILPLFMAPLAAAVIAGGLRGFRRNGLTTAWRATRHFRYWSNYLVVFLILTYLPSWLVFWTPELGSFAVETLSIIVRFSLALAVLVTCWLYFLSMAARLAALVQPATAAPNDPESEDADQAGETKPDESKPLSDIE